MIIIITINVCVHAARFLYINTKKFCCAIDYVLILLEAIVQLLPFIRKSYLPHLL